MNRPVINRVLANRPLLRVLATEAADAAGIPAANRQQVEDRVVERLASNPVVTNETNSEPWWQSRIYIGVITAIVGMIWNQVDPTAVAEIASGAGALVALIGRSLKNKGPIDWKRPWTVLGIGR